MSRACPLKQAVITGAGRVVRAPFADGLTVADILFSAGYALNTACGGRGVCRRCRIWLGEGEYEELTGWRFRVEEGEEREALGCQIRPLGYFFHVRVPDESLIEQEAQIHEDFVLPAGLRRGRVSRITVRVAAPQLGRTESDCERLDAALRDYLREANLVYPLDILRSLPATLRQEEGTISVILAPDGKRHVITDIEAGDRSNEPIVAVAADIGTTTVVCALLDLREGRIIARASRYNQQIRKADDVASRISFCRGPEEIEWMRRLIVEETLNPLIHEMCEEAGLAPARIVRISAAGNTVMTHLLLGLPPTNIGVIPFNPVIRKPPPCLARAIGLDVGASALLDIVPAMSGYVGGDITADLCAARVMASPGPSLLVDIGTNGEMALWQNGRLRVAATAAGPAFEGAGVRHGCRAAAGAIERFRWGERLEATYKIIGPRSPVGLCGSALIDFLAESRRIGLLNEFGRFDLARLREAGRYLAVPDPRGVTHACLVVPEDKSGIQGPIFITEKDVAELLKAKAAISAGIQTLMETADCRIEDLHELILAGGFARHIDLEQAIRIGLLPDLPLSRIRVIGNGSLAGAVMAQLDDAVQEEFDRIIACADTVELNLAPQFALHYTDAMRLSPL